MHRSILQTLWDGVQGIFFFLTQWARLEIGFWVLLIGMAIAIVGFQAMGIVGVPALVGSGLMMVSLAILGVTVTQPLTESNQNHPLRRMIGQLSRLLLGTIALCITIAGLDIVLYTLGLASGWRYVVSFMTGLVLTLLIAIGLSVQQHRRIVLARSQRNGRSDSFNALEGLSNPTQWIVRKLQTHSPEAWEDYQDWLHDILLDRDRLMSQSISPWKVKLITRWRLLGWSSTVMMISLKQSIERWLS